MIWTVLKVQYVFILSWTTSKITLHVSLCEAWMFTASSFLWIITLSAIYSPNIKFVQKSLQSALTERIKESTSRMDLCNSQITLINACLPRGMSHYNTIQWYGGALNVFTPYIIKQTHAGKWNADLFKLMWQKALFIFVVPLQQHVCHNIYKLKNGQFLIIKNTTVSNMFKNSWHWQVFC